MIGKALRMLLWLVLVTGVAYPLLITLVMNVTMPHKATGSLILKNEHAVGSRFIAQQFKKEIYFWPRPSSNNYNPLSSGGSNLGPTSLKLKDQVKERKEHLVKIHGSDDLIPIELLYTSGSGLDPHISPQGAYYQVNRIAKARKLNDADKDKIIKLIVSMTKSRYFGLLGQPYVNVLELNMALDAAISSKKNHEPQNGVTEDSPGEGSPGRGNAPLGKRVVAGIAALDELQHE